MAIQGASIKTMATGSGLEILTCPNLYTVLIRIQRIITSFF